MSQLATQQIPVELLMRQLYWLKYEILRSSDISLYMTLKIFETERKSYSIAWLAAMIHSTEETVLHEMNRLERARLITIAGEHEPEIQLHDPVLIDDPRKFARLKKRVDNPA